MAIIEILAKENTDFINLFHLLHHLSFHENCPLSQAAIFVARYFARRELPDPREFSHIYGQVEADPLVFREFLEKFCDWGNLNRDEKEKLLEDCRLLGFSQKEIFHSLEAKGVDIKEMLKKQPIYYVDEVQPTMENKEVAGKSLASFQNALAVIFDELLETKKEKNPELKQADLIYRLTEKYKAIGITESFLKKHLPEGRRNIKS